jgi:hypothetical protein
MGQPATAAAGPTGGFVPATTADLQRYAGQFVQLDTDRDGFVKVRRDELFATGTIVRL